MPLPPIPVGVPPGHSYWNDWYEKLRRLINTTAFNHNDLVGLQGGSAGEYYHLTAAEHTAYANKVTGPASATDNAVARFDGTTGKIIQNSSVTIADTGEVTVAGVASTPSFHLQQGYILANNSTSVAYTFDGLPPKIATIDNSGDNRSQISISKFRANAAVAAVVEFNKSNSNTVGTNSSVSSGDDLGRIRFTGADGTNYIQSSMIFAEVDDTVSTGIVPGRLRFLTADRTGTLVSRVGIDSRGTLETGINTVTGSALSTTSPAYFRVGAQTFTDSTTLASGTVTHGTLSSFDNAAIAASNATVTYTNASTLYVDGAPVAGSNVTITNPWSVYVAAGASRFADVTISGAINVTSGSITGITDLAVADGGTGASTASGARTNLGLDNLTQPLMNYGGYGFDGTNDYLDGNALTGIADGKAGTWVGVVRFANAASATEYLHGSTGDAFYIRRTTTGNILMAAENSAGTVIMSVTTTNTPCFAAGTYVVMCSWDLSTASTAKIVVNNTSATLTETVYTNDTIDYTVAEHSVASNAGGGNKFTGDIYSIWFNTSYLDVSLDSIKRKFSDVSNTPVFLGRNGELPTGTAPILFLGYSDDADWVINRGTATSSYTINSGPGATVTELKGQYAPLWSWGRPKTVTADYTVLRTDTTILNNRAATNTLTLPSAVGSAGRRFRIITLQAQAVNSASSNVVPIAGGAAGTAILAATAGAWCDLESDGTNWLITAS